MVRARLMGWLSHFNWITSQIDHTQDMLFVVSPAGRVRAGCSGNQQDEVNVASVLDLEFKNDIIEVTGQATEMSIAVLTRMHRKDAAFYYRLLDKNRELDSKLQLDTIMDLASQPAWTQYCKECTNLLVLRDILFGKRFLGLQVCTETELMTRMLRLL
jgi:hypothetical protein